MGSIDEINVEKALIIGAGPSGISLLKELTQAGIDATCIDKQEEVGGVWNWAWDGIEMTTSAVMSAFSDFPAEETSKIWSRAEYQEYIIKYIAFFGIKEKIHLKKEVRRCTREKDNGQWTWKVNAICHKENEEVEYSGSHLFVCTGGNQIARLPSFIGENTFTGTLLHTSEYKSADIFRNKTIVTVGMGESGSDLALESAQIAKKVHLSIRRASGWVVPRWRKTMPADNLTARSLWGNPRCMGRFLSWLMCNGDAAFGATPVIREMGKYNKNYVVRTAPDRTGIFGTYGTKNNSFIEAMVHHGASLQPNVKELGPGKRVTFVDGTIIEDVDVILFNTGFKRDFAMLQPHEDDDALRNTIQFSYGGSERRLWKDCIPTNFTKSNIAFVGCFFRPSFGSQTTSSEMQARLIAQVLVNPKNVLPPSNLSMQLQIDIDSLKMHSLFGKEVENKSLGDHFMYMNDVASVLGCHPGSLGSLIIKSPLLACKIFFGPFLPSQFRLKGPGAVQEVAKNSIQDSWWGFRELAGIRLFRIGLFCYLLCIGAQLTLSVVHFFAARLPFFPKRTLETLEAWINALNPVGNPTTNHTLSEEELRNRLELEKRTWKLFVNESKYLM